MGKKELAYLVLESATVRVAWCCKSHDEDSKMPIGAASTLGVRYVENLEIASFAVGAGKSFVKRVISRGSFG